MSVTVLLGHVLDRLREIPAESVNCVVTSPPYFGLRDYGLTPTIWGGHSDCDHDWTAAAVKMSAHSDAGKIGGKQASNLGTASVRTGERPGDFCSRCGAWRGSLGLEPTPDLFVEHIVTVFAGMRHALRNDGTLWLNLGDSYAGSWGAQRRRATESDNPTWHASQIKNHPKRASRTGSIKETGLKPKDLIGIPWRVAFALQADGWYLRQDIIWSKPNPMPESVTDRCTKAHEYLFLLSKSGRYFYNQGAIAEPLGAASVARLTQPGLDEQAGSDRVPGKTNGPMKAVGRRAAGNRSHKGTAAHEAGEEHFRTKAGLVSFAERERDKVERGDLEGTRNKRSVWTVATMPLKEAHFATFPPALVEPCILAGCPPGGTVLDPFGGSGTTGLVADRLRRNAILIELNPEYAAMARRRIDADAPLLARAAE